jgi:hypothetical protein
MMNHHYSVPGAVFGPGTPLSNTVARSNADQSGRIDARARAAFSVERITGAASEARAAEASASAAAARARQAIPDPLSNLSTVAVAGALNSVPATLNMMQHVAAASASGDLSEADMEQLAAAYAQLVDKIASVVGSSAANAQTSSSAGNDSEQDDNASNTYRETSDDQRSTLTQTERQPLALVQGPPVERMVTTTTSTLVPDGPARERRPEISFRTHEIHVGTDSYEPVSTRQAETRLGTPATFGRIEQHTETHRVLVAQVAQITQLSEVGHMTQVPQISAIV